MNSFAMDSEINEIDSPLEDQGFFDDGTVVPNSRMTEMELIYCFVRLVIFISILMLIFRYSYWWLFLIIGLLFAAVLYFVNVGIEFEDD